MIKVEVKKPISYAKLMHDVRRVWEDYTAREFRELFYDASDEYEDRCKITKAAIHPDEVEMIALMGGYINGLFVDDIDENELTLSAPSKRTARLLEYGAPNFPATRPRFHMMVNVRRQIQRIRRITRDRIKRIFLSTTLQ